MKRDQARDITKRVAAFFPNWRADADTVKMWVDRLEIEDYEMVNNNLESYLKQGKEFAPSLSVLIRKGSLAQQLPLHVVTKEDEDEHARMVERIRQKNVERN